MFKRAKLKTKLDEPAAIYFVYSGGNSRTAQASAWLAVMSATR
jgi:hypothetical protein